MTGGIVGTGRRFYQGNSWCVCVCVYVCVWCVVCVVWCGVCKSVTNEVGYYKILSMW